jgi:hypothetical protein
MAICRKCSNTLTDDNQYPSFKRLNRDECTDCSKAQSRKYYHAHKAKTIERNRRWRQANPDRLRELVQRSKLKTRKPVRLYDRSLAIHKARLVFKSLTGETPHDRNMVAAAIAAEILRLALESPAE